LVDPEGISARVERLGPLLVELEQIETAGRAAYAGSLRTRLAAAHAIQLAVQICIDIGAHLISEQGLETPSDYRGVFGSLRDAGLDAELASRLGDAAGMRNILVHDYLEVDDDEVWAAIGRLDDLRQFAAFAQAQS
jgi:uncharacterized protein YutE (UPF0331/DUF86 family)